MKWTNVRCKELDLLQRLLNEVSSMNHGSNIVGRLIECEKIARKLNSGNMQTGARSLPQFLTELAIEDRKHIRRVDSRCAKERP